MAKRQRGRGNGLKRRRGTRRTKRTFLVLCEGAVTEPEYLYALRSLREVNEVASVEIRVDRARSGQVPLPLVEAAIEVKEQIEEVDEVWCLFDVEAPQPHPNLAQALARARNNGIEIAVSNPCFEIWLALHFDKHNAWLSSDEAVRLRQRRDGSTGKEVDGQRYMPLRDRAVQNAQDLRDSHAKNGKSFPRDNPSSGVYRLLEAIERGTSKGS